MLRNPPYLFWENHQEWVIRLDPGRLNAKNPGVETSNGTKSGNQGNQSNSKAKHWSRRLLLLLVSVQLAKLITVSLSPIWQSQAWIVTVVQRPPYTTLASDFISGPNSILAPYGYLWYIFYWPARYGLYALAVYLAAVDSVVLWFLRPQTPRSLLMYQAITAYAILIVPDEALIYGMIFLGLRNRLALALAVVTKLPFGAPLYVWQFVLSHSIPNPFNWAHYVIMAALWLYVLFAKKLPGGIKGVGSLEIAPK